MFILSNVSKITGGVVEMQNELSIEKSIEMYISKFSVYHLSDESIEILRKYFRYCLNNKNEYMDTVPFNFMVHCSDEDISLDFVESVIELTEEIKGRKLEISLVEERDLASIGSLSVDTHFHGDVYVINKCSMYTDFNDSILDILGNNASKNLTVSRMKIIEGFRGKPEVIKFMCGPDRVLRAKYKGDNEFYNDIFRYHIYIGHMNKEEIKKLVHEDIAKHRFVESQAFNSGIDDYINKEYMKGGLKDYFFVRDLIEKVMDRYYSFPIVSRELSAEHVPEIRKNMSYEDVATDLEKLVGLSDIKTQLRSFEKYVKFVSDMKNREGVILPDNNLHMLFMGNPGTGKTTVAKILAKIMNGLGILETDKLVVAERKDLVAEYVGQTAPKTAAVIEKAIGGILFIDEAYSLTAYDSNRDFGTEVIDTLLTAMEENKSNLVVIFAGYKDEMTDFLDSNPGLASRIGYKYYFPDYSTEELVEIFGRRLTECGFIIDEDVIPKIWDIMEHFHKLKNFGNGRFVGTVIQQVIIQHATNEPDEDNMTRISISDIPTIASLEEAYGREE